MNVRIGIAILQMTHDRDASLYNVNNRVSNEKHTISFSFFFFFFLLARNEIPSLASSSRGGKLVSFH